jgi:hypothetical protein
MGNRKHSFMCVGSGCLTSQTLKNLYSLCNGLNVNGLMLFPEGFKPHTGKTFG